LTRPAKADSDDFLNEFDEWAWVEAVGGWGRGGGEGSPSRVAVRNDESAECSKVEKRDVVRRSGGGAGGKGWRVVGG